MADIITVDAQGLSCPQPVIMAQKAIQANPESALDILVDSGAARENVTRLGIRMGYKVAVTETEDGWKLSLTK